MELKYEIVKDVCVLNNDGKSTSKELKIIKWGNNEPTYDIRRWREGTPSKGISLTQDEAVALLEALKNELEQA